MKAKSSLELLLAENTEEMSPSSSSQIYTYLTANYVGKGKYKVIATAYASSSGSGDIYAKVSGGGAATTQIWSKYVGVSGTFTETFDIDYQFGELAITFMRESATFKMQSASIYYIIEMFSIIKLYPKNVIEIGNLGTGTSYGKHIDNVYYGGIMLKKETTATTGNIALGNAVGYITVNLNGEIVKIPYYGD